MGRTIELPLWLAVICGILVAIALLDRLLVPSVRWYLRRRLNHAIADLNQRLELKIPPFKLTRREILIDRLSHDPQVMNAVMAHARDEKIPVDVAGSQAVRYARETVPAFSAFAYFSFGIRAAKWLSQALYRVRLGRSDDEGLAAIEPDATVIFVMNHRSNMDYVLVTYLAATRSALSYAVGEWARVWPLQMLIRSMGAYFIRRRSRNQLYRRVLARYVQMATEGGVTQAIFLEGGLSRDGLLQEPKLGLLSYIVAGFDPALGRDVVFVPVALNYDRVLEDRILLAARGKEKARFRVGPLQIAGFLSRHLWLRISGRFHRYGYACVSFGSPVSLRDTLAERMPEEGTDDLIPELGQRLMDRVAELVPVLPVPLISTILLETGGLDRTQLEGLVKQRMAALDTMGVYSHIPHHDLDYAVTFGVRILVERRLAIERDGRITPVEGERPLLEYYANTIAHFRPAQAETG